LKRFESDSNDDSLTLSKPVPIHSYTLIPEKKSHNSVVDPAVTLANWSALNENAVKSLSSSSEADRAIFY
jgi:hypothetical protein